MRSVIYLLLTAFLLGSLAIAEEAGTPQSAMSSCTFQDGSQLTVRYRETAPARKGDLPTGKVWSPGEVPMLLFTEVPLKVANTDLPVGAYSMYVIPSKDKWTLIVSKNVNASGAYDEKMDIVRTPMDTGKLPVAMDAPKVSLAHISPKVCSLRVDYGKTGAWADAFEQK
jgi:hypothetical protein